MTGGYCFDTYNKECGYFLPPVGTFMTSDISDDKYFAKMFKNIRKFFAQFSNLLYHLNFLNGRSNLETPKSAKLKKHKPCFMNLLFMLMSNTKE